MKFGLEGELEVVGSCGTRRNCKRDDHEIKSQVV